MQLFNSDSSFNDIYIYIFIGCCTLFPSLIASLFTDRFLYHRIDGKLKFKWILKRETQGKYNVKINI